jgi:hypothetical protein
VARFRLVSALVIAVIAFSAGLVIGLRPSSDGVPAHLWPPHNASASPTQSAIDFAHAIGFTSAYARPPLVTGATVTVDISATSFASPLASPLTQVTEFQFRGRWYVSECHSSSLIIDSPRPRDVVSTFLSLRASTTAYEARVDVQVRDVASWSPEVSSFVMGGSMGQMGAASGLFRLSASPTHRVALILSSRDARDGGVMAATVIPLIERPQ